MYQTNHKKTTQNGLLKMMIYIVQYYRWKSLKFSLMLMLLEWRYHPFYWTVFTAIIGYTQIFHFEWLMPVMVFVILFGTILKTKYLPDSPEYERKRKIISRAYRIQNPDI